MAIKVYTEQELKALVLDQINRAKKLEASFTPEQSDEAYDEAVRECGFECPASDDADLKQKNQWLIERMRHWYVIQLRLQYPLVIDVSDIKAGTITKALGDMAAEMDKRFDKAKEDPQTAHLFTNAGEVFGVGLKLVVPSGFVDDRIGQPIEVRS